MDRPKLEVADVLRRYGEAYREQHSASLSTAQRRVMSAIELCRTAALGSHLEQCDQCRFERVAYDSCRNRHCPKCQSLILFRATSETLRTIAADPKHLGAEIGFFAVLHSWGQNLLFHPHLHCVVPGGGLSPDGDRWISCRPGFFLPVRVLSRLFRRLFLELLEKAFDKHKLRFFTSLCELQQRQAFLRYLAPLRQSEWVVYAKPPFAGPQQVLDYVGRYTHRVAISNNRLLDIEDGQVQFRYKDYRHDSQQKVMTLSADEFIRRFLLHVLPNGFQRIRYYGFLGNRFRQEKLQRCRQLLGMASADQPPPATEPPKDYRDRYQEQTGQSLRLCPACHRGQMIRIGTPAFICSSPTGKDTS